MNGPVRIINAMRDMALGEDVDLEYLHRHFPDSVYHRGRPHMLVIKLSNGRNVQVFRRGKIQILGNVSHSDAQWMLSEIVHQLQTVYPHLQPQPMTLRNMVVSVQLKTLLALHNIPSSSNQLFYESELFPAALIRKWHPIHIAVFHNGQCILTGLTDLNQVYTLVDELMSYLSELHVTS